MLNMRESMLCVWGWLVISIGVVDVHDTNMGFKPPCHFVIVHMNSTLVVVVLVGALWGCIFSFVASWSLIPWNRWSPRA